MKNMPCNLEVEKMIISMLMEKKVNIDLIINDLKPKYFFDIRNKTLFLSIAFLLSKKGDFDATELIDHLKITKKIKAIGGIKYLEEISKIITINSNFENALKVLKELSKKREIILMSQKISQKAEESLDLDAELGEIEKEFLALTRNYNEEHFVGIGKAIEIEFEKIKKNKTAGAKINGIGSSIASLDFRTLGFQKGDLIILAGRPSMGKTALALKFALHASKEHNVLFFSLEMPTALLVQRLLSMRSGIDLYDIKSANISKENWEILTYVKDEVSKLFLTINDSSGLKISDLERFSKKFAAKNKVDMIIIDYLQLIRGGSYSKDRQQEVSQISRDLKALARDMDIPVLTLSQLSRAVEYRQDKRPMLSDLRESGAIEQDADIVMLLYREEYYKRNFELDEDEKNTKNSIEGITELNLAKHRNGALAEIKLIFNKKIGEFTEIDDKIKE